ncbi:MAG TPA: DinB family protein [Dehalococcoidia bacterium]|nr:DinB family protein [Dehalococcoidia bacterium]
MSSVTQFIRDSLRQLHASYDEGLADLTSDQLHWRANDSGQPIAFIVWHYVRTEDNIIQFVLQQKPTVWIDGGWYEKFGLHRTAQGTGMSLEDAQGLRIESLEDWGAYQSAVWKATDEFLANADDAILDRRTTVKPLGEMPVRNAIGMMCLTHGFTHLGEVQHLRGLMGLRGMGW